MTEEIMIDGVDVAGCEHYCEKINTGSGFIQSAPKQGYCLHNITGLQNSDIYFRALSFPKCREQSNCYYKQLKRSEQENKDVARKAEEYCSVLEEIRGKLKYWESYFCDNCPFQNKDACDKNEKDIGENTCTSVQLIKMQDKINEALK